MDFSLSSEQQLLADSVDRFVQDVYPFESRRKIAESELGYSKENWAQFAELGWLGMPFSEDDGGFDGTPVETMILMQSFGRGLVCEPFLATVVVGGGLLAAAGSDEQKSALIPDLIGGELQLAFTQAEAQSRYSLSDVATTAVRDGGGWKLNGAKSVVVNGAAADKLIVSARTGGDQRDAEGISLFLVDGDAAGLSRRGYATVDGLRAAEIQLNDVMVDQSAMLGGEGAALPVIEQVTDQAIAALCAEAVGAMQAVTDITNEYLKTRVQFGQPIGRFQVLQHRMVDMFMHCEQSKSMAYMVTLKLDEGAAARSKAASAAKVQIGQSGRFVGQEAVQLHGGMGMTDELNVGHYFKRLTMIDVMYGNVDHHLKRYGGL